MTQIIHMAAAGTVTKHGKRLAALSMYGKGKAFVAAYLLVTRAASSEHFQYVALHLLAQGIEVTLKAFLLLRDYDKYIGKLRKPLGHDLVATAEEAIACYGLKPMRTHLKEELQSVSKPYAKHMLRYGNIGDIFIAPCSIQHRRVLRRIAAAIRLAERELQRAG